MLDCFGQVNAVHFFGDASPGSDWMIFVEEKLAVSGDDTPFLLEDSPGLL